MKLRISEALWAPLRAKLFERTDVETAGLILVEAKQTPSGRIAVAREAFALPENAYLIRRCDQLSIDPVVFNRVTRRARDRGWGVFTIHTHPGASEAWFSQADDAGDARLMPSLCCQMPSAPHGSLVVVHTGDVIARTFRPDGSKEEIAVGIVGNSLTSPRVRHASREPWFVRQELALGLHGQSQLRQVRVAVIGLGGIGSLVSMQLAHLGIGELVLIDGDVVEASNLSRIVGATQSDIGAYKVDVAARYARSTGFVYVNECREFLSSQQEALIASCDVVISCVDRHLPRALLNRIAYRYCIPTIDLGTVFRVDGAGAIIGDAGRVVVIGPGRPCLACWGHIDSKALRIESLSADDRASEEDDGYIQGADEAQPSVIAFNTSVAGAGVTELMRIVTGFSVRSSPPVRLAFSFSEGTVKRNSLAATCECRICGRSDAVAA